MRPVMHGLPMLLSASMLLCGGIAACAAATDDALEVRQSDRLLSQFDLARLRDLPQVEIATPQSQGAQSQKGPTVRSILGAAGVTDMQRVRVEGRDPAQTLAADEITDQLILNVTKRNTLKLTGTQLPRARWVRDVTALVVNP